MLQLNDTTHKYTPLPDFALPRGTLGAPQVTTTKTANTDLSMDIVGTLGNSLTKCLANATTICVLL